VGAGDPLPTLADVPEPTADERPDGATAPAGTVPVALRAACALLGLEALGLVAGAVVLLVDTLTGHPTDRASALLTAAFALVGAAAVGFGARGLLRLHPAARTPIVVLQVLAVPVGYQLAFDSERPAWGWPILLGAVAVLYLLFTPPVRAVLDRPEPTR
jgi:hypothetical protein